MNIREIATSRLKEYENNPRNNDLAVEKVKYSIERFGFMFPVVIDMNYVIVAGHTRVRACREMGIQSIPCIIADELTDEQINLFRLVDNKTSEYSDWDFERLKEELSTVDLTLEKNQLILDRFELSAEVFDLEPEQAEIRIPTFNFMGVKGNKQPKEKKPDFGFGDEPTATVEAEVDNGPDFETPPAPVSEPVVASAGEPAVAAAPVTQNMVMEPEPQKKEARPFRTFCQFRFGDVSFYISQVEQDRLNEKYAEYIDSGAILQESFASYLMKGVEEHD